MVGVVYSVCKLTGRGGVLIVEFIILAVLMWFIVFMLFSCCFSSLGGCLLRFQDTVVP